MPHVAARRWTLTFLQIVRILLTLFSNSLILPAVSSTSRRLDLPPIPLQSPVQVVEHGEKANEAGLFSAFTSYVSSLTNDEPPEPSDQEIEYTLCTIDCVNACSLEDILSNIRYCQRLFHWTCTYSSLIVECPTPLYKLSCGYYSPNYQKKLHPGSQWIVTCRRPPLSEPTVTEQNPADPHTTQPLCTYWSWLPF